MEEKADSSFTNWNNMQVRVATKETKLRRHLVKGPLSPQMTWQPLARKTWSSCDHTSFSSTRISQRGKTKHGKMMRKIWGFFISWQNGSQKAGNIQNFARYANQVTLFNKLLLFLKTCQKVFLWIICVFDTLRKIFFGSGTKIIEDFCPGFYPGWEISSFAHISRHFSWLISQLHKKNIVACQEAVQGFSSPQKQIREA